MVDSVEARQRILRRLSLPAFAILLPPPAGARRIVDELDAGRNGGG